MIAKLILALLNAIGKIVGILLLPLDLAVSALLPDLSSVMVSITTYLTMPSRFMSWTFSLLHVPNIVPTLLISYWIFKYAVTGAVAGVKKVITLYQRFKM